MNAPACASAERAGAMCCCCMYWSTSVAASQLSRKHLELRHQHVTANVERQFIFTVLGMRAPGRSVGVSTVLGAVQWLLAVYRLRSIYVNTDCMEKTVPQFAERPTLGLPQQPLVPERARFGRRHTLQPHYSCEKHLWDDVTVTHTHKGSSVVLGRDRRQQRGHSYFYCSQPHCCAWGAI